MNYETMLAYDEYCQECDYEGVIPKDFWKWYYEGE